MGQYRIVPSGVVAVLKQTATDAEQLETILKPLSGAVQSAAGGTGNSGAIVPALSDFFSAKASQVQGISTRVHACLEGAADASRAYITGDEHMAATTQAKAVAAANLAAR